MEVLIRVIEKWILKTNSVICIFIVVFCSIFQESVSENSENRSRIFLSSSNGQISGPYFLVLWAGCPAKTSGHWAFQSNPKFDRVLFLSRFVQTVLEFHILWVTGEIVVQVIFFYIGMRPIPQDLVRCLNLLCFYWVPLSTHIWYMLFYILGWFFDITFMLQLLAVATYGSASGTLDITVQMHRKDTLGYTNLVT
jgi:hypothetical protein